MQRQSTTNKQGSAPELCDDPEYCRGLIENQCRESYTAYESLLGYGLSKELARMVLPLNTYTAWYWQANLHNILHLLTLRLNPHAQYECRVYAEAMHELLKPVFPAVIKAWEAH